MMNYRAIGLLCLIAATGVAGEPALRAQLSSPASPYHRSVEYALTLEGSAGLQCDFPELAADVKRMEVRQLASESAVLPEGGIRLTQRYLLDPVFPGTYVIPALNISWRDGDKEGVLRAPSMALHARDLSQEEKEQLSHFAAITSPSALLPQRRASMKTLFAAMGAFLAILAAIIWYWRRRSRSIETAAPLAPAWETALNRLRELRKRDLPGTGRVDAYYVDLSSILRYYIEDRFHIQAPEQTTPEFLDIAARHGLFTQEQQLFLSDFLRQCDRVKFARFLPGLEDMEGHYLQVKHFIQDTIPEESSSSSLEAAA